MVESQSSEGQKMEQNSLAVNPMELEALGIGQPSSSPRNLDLLLDVPLRVTVELGRAELPIREVLALAPGSVVELSKMAGEAVDILVNGKPIAHGEVVVVDDMFGVRVTDIIPPSARVHALR